MTNLLFLVAIPILLIVAPSSHVFALSPTNQTATNETNSLLKQILDQQKLQTQLTQDNMQVLAIKLDIIKVELERILVQLQAPPILPTPPPLCPTAANNMSNCIPLSPPLSSFPVPMPPSADCTYTVFGAFC